MHTQFRSLKQARQSRGSRATLTCIHATRAGPDPPKKLSSSILSSPILTALMLAVLFASPPNSTFAQNRQSDIAAAARAGAVEHAQKMRRLFPDSSADEQATPSVIQQVQIDQDSGGAIASFQPGGLTVTGKNAFFQDLGSNRRTCFTCHQPEDAWGLSARHARDRFYTNPNDPLFRLVDGATCPSDDVSTLAAKRKAYGLLLDKGLIRVGLPMPTDGLEFRILNVNDPYNCTTNPTTGLTGPTTGTLSIYRRPLPTTNLGFLSAIMWDGREPDLFSQAVDATLGHAQGTAPPTPLQQQQIVGFEGCTGALTPAPCAKTPVIGGVFTAQIFDNEALFLSAGTAKGGPIELSKLLPKFFIGVNDPLGLNPTGAPFTSEIFGLYGHWAGVNGHGPKSARRQAIMRGEQLFNTKKFDITEVSGLNDALHQSTIPGFCGTCHDTPNVGNHSVKAPLNIGVADAGNNTPPALDISGLPVFSLWCTSGPLAGTISQVTDPGRALITGKCADIGKVKGPILRGLAARAPYFHNGSAATLRDVVEFYNRRFEIGFTDQEKADLTAFLDVL